MQMWFRKSKLRWLGHFERKEEEDLISTCRNIVVPGNTGRDRPRKRWRDVLEDDLKKDRLDRGRTETKDKERRRAQIIWKAFDLREKGKRDEK